MEAIFNDTRKTSLSRSALTIELVAALLRRAFGCWHLQISRPFSNGKDSYRVCIRCGAKRRFDTATWQTSGTFYYEERQM
jgi:hypothetical protein